MKHINLAQDIEDILMKYVSIPSITFSKNERLVEGFFMDCFKETHYFKQHKSFGLYKINNDPLNRNVCFAFLRAHNNFIINKNIKNTICLLHHYDVVPVEDYKNIKEHAFNIKEIEKQLRNNAPTNDKELHADLLSDLYFYGRGTADMKGGGAIQIAILRELANRQVNDINIILIAVPDEENLSAGMIAATEFLSDLKDTEGLEYKIMINSEPHERKNLNKGMFSLGSIGKIMPFVYVRGALSHVGKIFEGINPINIINRIMHEYETNIKYSDHMAGECAPPPTILYARDLKEEYNVSIPLSAAFCLNILTLHSTPLKILHDLKINSEHAFKQTIEQLKKDYDLFMEYKNIPNNLKENLRENLDWEISVHNFMEIKDIAKKNHPNFDYLFQERLNALKEKFINNKITLIDANFNLISFILEHVGDSKPRIIYGLMPPYYPAVTNMLLDNLEPDIKDLDSHLNDFLMKEFGESYDVEHFFTGISDLSYANIKDAQLLEEAFMETMPFYNNLYKLNFSCIEKISMPCINIGPLGKGLHRYSERVLREDLLIKTPALIYEAIRYLSKY